MLNVNLFFIGIIFLANPAFAAKEIAGEIVSVSGIAFIRPDKSTEPLPKSPPKAKPGDNVYVGDVINTSSEGAVKILMRDKSIVDLGSSSLFKVDEYIHNNGNNRKAKMDLMFGKVRVAVTKKIEGGGAFQVKTRGATMGVRGTEFSIVEGIPASLSQKQKAETKNQPVAEAAKTQVTVFQGKVDVAQAAKPNTTGTAAVAPKMVSLTANMQLTTGAGVSPGVASNPVTLSNSQIAEMKTTTTISDNTFVKAITIEPMSSNEGGSSANGRSPASEGSGPVLAMIPKDLPKIPESGMPVMDIVGLPQMNNPFANNNNMMKRLVVTIVTQ